MQVFRDATGRPGPSTWELGEYPQGHDDYPVNGVSWYEAVVYAEFAGKQLPTIYHWQKAASPGMFAAIVELSNFGGAGPARVGSHNGISAFGTQDMAGNVKEWSWNEFGGQRFINGGAWNQPLYMFSALDARPAWDRSAQNGIRCVRYDVSEEVGLRAPVTRPPTRDFSKEKPVSDEVFRLYRGLYPMIRRPSMRVSRASTRRIRTGSGRRSLLRLLTETSVSSASVHPEACNPTLSDDPLCGPRHVDAAAVAATSAGTFL